MLKWEERFWSKVDKRGPDECWPWKATVSKNGYGSFGLNGSAQTSSRVAYWAANKQYPGKSMVLHKCDNRLCCNPAHLYLGDVRQNSRDMVERGRARNGNRVGSSNGANKLTEADILLIREMFERKMQNTQIATKFGVHHSTISKIRRGHYWNHVAETGA